MVSFIAWAAQAANIPGDAVESARFMGIFGSKTEAAVISVLLALIPVLGATAYYIRKKARAAAFPDRVHQQRRADDQWRKDMKSDLDRELQAFKKQMDNVEGISRNNTARIEEVHEAAQSAASKAEELDGKVDVLTGYLHQGMHDLRDDLQRLTGALSGELRVMAGSVGEVTGSVRTLIATLRDSP